MLIAKQTFMSRRRLSYIGFTILVMIIIAVPYLISTINRPDLAIAGRDLGTYRGTLQSMSDALASLFFVGDYNPAHNLPQRPLIDLISGFFVLIGLFTTLRFWAQPRFILILIASAILLPTMIITESSPNFLALSSLLPMIALYFGIGVQIVWQSVAARWRWLLGLLLIALYGYNIYWTSNDLFNRWPMLEEVQAVYHAPQGELARYIDRTVDEIPTVICIPNWDQPPEPTSDLSDTRLTLLMMNRQQNQLRRVDCRNGLLLANGGEMTQMILPETVVLESMHDHLKQWLNQAEPISGDDIPEESVYMFKVSDTLADTAGMFLLTSPVSYPPDIESEVGATAVEPPVRFGGNITLLGYELTNREVNDAGELIPPTVMAGDVVPVITYWRIEGEVPRDLTFFTHILSDPVTIAANRDYISADPRLLQERDVLIQVTDVQLAESLLAGDYTVSTGAYQDIDKTRLVVLENEQPRGDRLFLYPITIEAQPEAEEE